MTFGELRIFLSYLRSFMHLEKTQIRALISIRSAKANQK
ncbi:hypothetical protein AVDCRST_MAG92-1928 [uncultured Coleofasciculus sp.]|uniref:Uncharacterized protein n=1 Tax=uncultured Coleofasciculus sp. TaxID=1267456 RepID=A0A6J4IG37_9CYAN|nr:hypothetical protein AVDCRST_MAG92-1928 [uncultured Coleofasciculus sp.]